MHFRDNHRTTGYCESCLINFCDRFLPFFFPLSIFSSKGCEGQRVLVLITDEECRAWTPGLTCQHSTPWDHFSVDGAASVATCPQIKCVCVCLCVVALPPDTYGCQVVKLSWAA